MKDREAAEKWEDWMEEELRECEGEQCYDTVVRSPNKVVHVLKDEEIEVGETGVTLCGQKFVAGEEQSNKKWNLLDDFYFSGTGEDTLFCITCKKCRVLEVERMKSEIQEKEESKEEEGDFTKNAKRFKLVCPTCEKAEEVSFNNVSVTCFGACILFRCSSCSSIHMLGGSPEYRTMKKDGLMNGHPWR